MMLFKPGMSVQIPAWWMRKSVPYVGLLCFFGAAPQGAPNFIVDLCEERMMPDGSVSKSPDLSSGGLFSWRSWGKPPPYWSYLGYTDGIQKKHPPRFFAVDSDGEKSSVSVFEHRKLRELELEDHFPHQHLTGLGMVWDTLW